MRVFTSGSLLQVKGVEQILGPEEQVSVDEFAKFVSSLSIRLGRAVSILCDFTGSAAQRRRQDGRNLSACNRRETPLACSSVGEEWIENKVVTYNVNPSDLTFRLEICMVDILMYN